MPPTTPERGEWSARWALEAASRMLDGAEGLATSPQGDLWDLAERTEAEGERRYGPAPRCPLKVYAPLDGERSCSLKDWHSGRCEPEDPASAAPPFARAR